MSRTASPLILSVDLGTSGAKVGLVSPEGDVVAAAFEPTSLVLLPGGGAQQDPGDWWRAVTAAARTIIQATGRASDVVAVACTAQWSGTVALDENSRHLAPALIWMDMRGAPLVRERIGGRIRIAGYEVRKAFRWIRLTGGAPEKSGKDPVGHILWLARQHPEAYRAAAVLLEPKDYLNARLTGRPAAGFDSIALHWVTDNRRIDQVSLRRQADRAGRSRPGQAPRASPAHGRARTATERSRHGAGCSGGTTGRHGGTGHAHGRNRIGGDGGLPGPSLPGDVVLAHLPHPVQEDRRTPQHGLPAVGAPRPMDSRERAGDGRSLPGLPRQPPGGLPG